MKWIILYNQKKEINLFVTYVQIYKEIHYVFFNMSKNTVKIYTNLLVKRLQIKKYFMFTAELKQMKEKRLEQLQKSPITLLSLRLMVHFLLVLIFVTYTTLFLQVLRNLG